METYQTNTLRNSFTLICPHFDNLINYPIDIAWAVFNGNGIFILAFRDILNVYDFNTHNLVHA